MRRLAFTIIMLLGPIAMLAQSDSAAMVKEQIKREIIEELRNGRDAEQKARP